MRVLCVLPCLPEDFRGECLNAVLNQTLLPDLILVLPKKGEGKTLPERISWVLNQALSHVRLEDFDYIVRVDADTVLPPNYIEENLKDKPDLCGKAGYGLIVKVKPFLKLLNGRFHPKSDDSYIRYKFRMKGLKVTDWKVKPVVKRKSGGKHGLKYFLYRGFNMYRLGYEPLHVLGSFRWEPRNFLTVFGYLLALLKRERRFDVAPFVWKQQINKLRKLLL